MKRLIICIAIVVAFTISAYAETESSTNEGQQNPMTGCGCPKMQQMQSHGTTKGTQQMPMEKSAGEGQQMPMMCPKMQQMQGQGMMQGGQQMPMMQMCMPMMQHMMGQNMMTRDMMYMVTDMMKMQKKIISGINPSERKEALRELDKMMEKMDRMMSDMRCSCKMMGGMMESPAEPTKKAQEEVPMQKEVPKADSHGH